MTSGAEWLDQLAGRRAETPLPTTDDFVLEVRVAADTDPHVHHLVVDSEGYRYEAGPAPSPHAWVRIDGEVADALRAGTISVTAAVQSGRIRVGGDLQALLDHQDALAAVTEHVTEETEATAGPSEPPE